MVATVSKLSTKEELCSGVVLKTDPDEVAFDYKFKDIFIDEENIIISDFLDRPRILVDLNRALDNELISEILPDDIDD